MTTWVVGDVQGCAAELERLIADLRLEPEDRLVLLGDLFHRGPDPLGVLRAARGARAQFVIGNHEHALLERLRLAPRRPDGGDRPALRTDASGLSAADLAGDSGRPLHLEAEGREEFLRFVQGHSGYFLDSRTGARSWWAVHAGVTPGRAPADSEVRDLIYPARVGGRRGPFWFEAYRGPELVLFGHLVQEEPLLVRSEGSVVAVGLDTGCMFGGWLTAYSPERDEFRRVRAARAYVARDE